MNRFVKYVFFLLLLSSALSFGLVLWSNLGSATQRDESLKEERRKIMACYVRMDEHTSHAVVTVERQEIRMNPDTQQNEAASTTILFGLTDEDFGTPKYVQRIVVEGNILKVNAIKLAFLNALPEEQQLLAGRTFYLFDTIGGIDPESEPFGLNPIGFPPLALRHDSPESTEYERQLWRPVWDNLMSGRPSGQVQRSSIPGATRQMEVGKIYEMFVGSIGVQVEQVEGDSHFTAMKWAMLQLARDQDTELATGIKTPHAGTTRP